MSKYIYGLMRIRLASFRFIHSQLMDRMHCVVVMLKLNLLMGLVKRKRAFEHAQYAHSDQAAHVQSIIRAFALYTFIRQYPMSLLADSEGPNKTARMRWLIWAFAVRISLKTHFRHGTVHIA